MLPTLIRLLPSVFLPSVNMREGGSVWELVNENM